ncbi:ATP-binding protein [Albidovulum sediminicola]|uniref:ATP-binding protein n=1 Tax=Albidovulum sediminicola TaxID=2984331 RepID=UPI0039910D47
MPNTPISASLKRILPRGLYGRAALILILPVVVVQLVVSVAFLQRHFEGVTRQMTQNIVLEIDLLSDAIESAPPGAVQEAALAVAGPLALDLDWADRPESDRRIFYDLSGRVVISTLRENVPGVGPVDLSDLGRVRLALSTSAGPVEVAFDRRRVSASNPHQLLVLMMVTGLLMTLVAFVFLRNQLRPIRRMAIAAEAFGKGRVLPYRPSGATEVRAAGHAFLHMRERIERQREQRTLMLSGVSHDLRTPLTRLKLGLSMLPDDDETRAMQRDVDDMQVLTDAFLAFVRGVSSDEESAPCDPAELAATAVADFRRTGAEVDLTGAAAGPPVTLRAHAVRRALDNLIGNAVRYGRRAEVSVLRAGGRIVFRVEDDGPGIPEARREEAQRPFTRLDPARNQDRGSGAGLGLAIAADIARSHGGQLRLSDSERLGGLSAEIVLPEGR